VVFDRKQHDWSEQARAQETNTLVSNANSYIGASNVGPNTSTANGTGNVSGAYSIARDVGTSHIGASASAADTRSSARLGARPQDLKLSTNSKEKDGDDASASYTDTSGAGPSAAKDDIYSDAMPYWRSSVMKDDTQSVMYGNTGLRKRKKKEDRSLKTEESKTKGNMQVETDTGQTACTLRRPKTGSVMQVEMDTGQTVYTQVEPEMGQTAYIQVEPDTGQTAYTLPSMAIPLPEEDRRVASLSVDYAVA